jgi:hypothetical protein
MRQVYRLLGLVRYGPGPVDTACGRALDLDRRRQKPCITHGHNNTVSLDHHNGDHNDHS